MVEFGAVLLSELSEPGVVALYRLAVSEADRFPEVARALNVYGRQATAAALREMLEGAPSAGLLIGADVEALLTRFLSLVLDDVPMSLALGLRAGCRSPRSNNAAIHDFRCRLSHCKAWANRESPAPSL